MVRCKMSAHELFVLQKRPDWGRTQRPFRRTSVYVAAAGITPPSDRCCRRSGIAATSCHGSYCLPSPVAIDQRTRLCTRGMRFDREITACRLLSLWRLRSSPVLAGCGLGCCGCWLRRRCSIRIVGLQAVQAERNCGRFRPLSVPASLAAWYCVLHSLVTALADMSPAGAAAAALLSFPLPASWRAFLPQEQPRRRCPECP